MTPDLKEARLQFKRALQNKSTSEAFQIALAYCDAFPQLSPREAVELVGKWLTVHAQGPSLDEWDKILSSFSQLMGSIPENPSEKLAASEQQMAVYEIYFIVIGLKKWRKSLRKNPSLFDTVLSLTLPTLARTLAAHIETRLLVIEAVEELLFSRDKSSKAKLQIAELRMHRAKLLAYSNVPNAKQRALDLLRQQKKLFANLSQKGFDSAPQLLRQTQEIIDDIA